MLQHDVDVHRLALDRALVGEHLHPVDQLHDPVGLVADQPRQRTIVVADRVFQQLRRAANARQRILDLVRQHRGKRDHRARRAAMGQLTVHLVGDGPLLQHDHQMVRPVRQRRNMQIDQTLARIARRPQIDLVFIDRSATRARLFEQRQQRAAERHELGQRMSPQQRQRGFEECLRGRIRIGDAAVARDHDHGMRQRIEHGVGGARRQRGHRLQTIHAAALRFPANDSNASARWRRTSDRIFGGEDTCRGAASRDRREPPPLRPLHRAPSRDACAHAAGRWTRRDARASRRRAFRSDRIARRAAGASRPTAGKLLSDLSRQPGPALRRTADHHRVGAGGGERGHAHPRNCRYRRSRRREWPRSA